MPNEKEWVAASEDAFAAQLSACADVLCALPGLRVFTVTGPTCSGKTTCSRLLTMHFEREGRHVIPLSVDDFYRNKADIPYLPDGRRDCDGVDSIDLPYLSVFLRRFLAGDEALAPHFDFLAGVRSGYTPCRMEKDDLLLLEGIQTMYPEVRAFLPPDATRFVAIEPIPADDCPLSSREVRLLRRLVRDIRTRGSDAAETLGMWDIVTDNEDRNIYPYLSEADFRINSFLSYELSVIRPFAEQVLADITPDSVYYDEKERLLSALAAYPVLDASLVPADSLFREFIGEVSE